MAPSKSMSELSSRTEQEKLSIKTDAYVPTEHEQQILDRQLSVPPVKASFRTLYRYATPMDVLILVISITCAIAAGTAPPLMTVVFGNITTSFSTFGGTSSTDPDSFRHDISNLALDLVYIGIGAFVATYIATVGFIYVGEHITQKTREKYLAAVLRQNIAYFDKLGAGEITVRITSDMNDLQAGMSQKVSIGLSAVATITTGLIVGFIKGWKLTLILLSVIISMVLVLGVLSKFMKKFNTLAQASSGAGATIAEEVLSSIRTAQALGTQTRLADQYEKYLVDAEVWGARMKGIVGLMLGSMLFIMMSDYALAFWQGSRFLVAGDIQIGQILTVLLSILLGATSLGLAAPNLQALSVAIATAGPIFTVIDCPPPFGSEKGKTPDHVDGEIELRGVRHIYPSRPEMIVLHGMDLKIPAGRVTALVGASGSGKSTIIGLLERFYVPVGGELLLDGEDVQTLDVKWLRRQMALVGQEPVLFSTSVYENIAHGLIGTELESASDEKKMELVVNAAKMANAHDFISTLPDGYNMNVGDRGFLLSGGQKQRIAIARAIVKDPRILLLDEATSALDTKSEGVVQAALDAASQGRTTIVIAHRLSTIKGADNIVVMSGGAIVEQGTHEDLIKLGGLYLQLIEAQRIETEKKAKGAGESTNETEDEHEDSVDDSKLATLTQVQTKGSLAEKDKENKEIHFKNSLWTLVSFIWDINRPEQWYMFLGFGFSALCGTIVPLQAIYLGKELAALSLPSDQFPQLRHDVNFWSLMYFITGLVALFSHAFQGYIFGYCSERLIFRARSKTLRSILRQEIAFFDAPENTSGALVSMITSEVTALNGISGTILGSVISSTTTVVLAIVISCIIKWKLALVVATSMPVLLACGFLRFRLLSLFNLRAQKAYAASASYACEATAAIRTITSLTREDDVLGNYHQMIVSQTADSLVSVLKSSSLYAASQSGMFFASALGFWWGGTLISRGELTIEPFFICFIATIFGAQSAGAIFSFAPDMAKSKQSAESIKNLFDRVPEIDAWSNKGSKIADVQGAIEFRDVDFRYPTRMSQPVLRGVNLKFEPGQNVALVGASGCGKSTIIAMMERFYDPQQGSIFLDGHDITQLNLQDYRSHISLVSQEPMLYSGSIKENILLGSDGDADEESVIRACKDANIYEFISSLDAGLETVVGSKGVLLSGGQKQRIAIARALIRNPKILLLDEATSALDSTSEAAVQTALDLASKGRTTISIAHRLSTIQKADVIYVIDAGRVVESGTHASLMHLRGRYWELVGLQELD